ncbi:MAG: hypothetical protein WA789_16690 [Candidatus Acidiferrum sp.]
MTRKRKSDVNNRARSCKSHISPARDAAARKWLKKSAASVASDETQQKLHAAAEPCIGSLSGGYSADAKSVRRQIRQRLSASR